jgi:hypothetical protein
VLQDHFDASFVDFGGRPEGAIAIAIVLCGCAAFFTVSSSHDGQSKGSLREVCRGVSDGAE